MGAEREALESLIKELQQSTSRLDQLKILSRAWRVLKGLGRRERLEVATHLGIEEGLPLLESLGSPGGLSPAALARAVAKAERAHRGDLDAILQSFRTPGERLSAIHKSIDLVETALLEEEDTPSPPPAAVESPKPSPSVPRPPQPPPPAPLPDAQTQPKLKPEPQPEPEPESKKMPAPPPPAKAVDVTGRSAGLAAATVEPSPPGKPARPEPPEPRTSLDARWAEVSRPATKAPPLPEPQPAASAKRLTVRFRELNRLLKGGEVASGRLESLLANFPPGWPRRRALAALIRSGKVDDVDALLAQIMRMERPMDEFWCLSALVHSRRLSAPQLEQALGRVRAPSSRRLLSRLRTAG